MSTTTKKKQQYSKKTAAPSFSKWFLLPPALMLAVVPLIMRYYEFENHLVEFGWLLKDKTVDFFLYYKMVAIIILGVVMLCIIAGRLFLDGSKIKFHTAFIPMLVYAVFVIISAIASQYPYFVSNGIREQFESVWVLLSYCIMAYYCFLFINSEKDVETVFFWLFIGASVICVIGVLQFLNGVIQNTSLADKLELDIFRTDTGQKLIVPKKLWKDLIYPEDPDHKFTFTFEKGRAYTTLYNPNYVGMYVTLIVPCLAAWMVTRKKKIALIFPAILMAGLFVVLYASGAKNGVVALVIGCVLYAVAYRRVFLKKPLIFVGALIMVVAFFFISDKALGHAITNGIKGMFNGGNKRIADAKLKKIETTDEDVVVFYGENELHLTALADEDNTYLYAQASDQDGNPVEYVMNEETGMADFMDERFEGISIFTSQAPTVDLILLGVHIDDGSIIGSNGDIDFRNFFFSNQVAEDGGYYNYNLAGNFVKMEDTETAVFTENPDLFSGRGYLWSKTIPMLKQYMIVGSGPDTFEVVFPQHDQVSMRQGGYGGMVITKPHNLFLQIGVNTGVVSLLGFLVFFGIYFVWSFKLFFIKNPNSYMAHMGVGILCGNFGYIISGIINDSTVCVAPIYWCFMGIGLAINVYCEGQLRKEQLSVGQLKREAALAKEAKADSKEKNSSKRKRG